MRTAFVLLSLALATVAQAHHRQTAPLTRFTNEGDTPANRVISLGLDFTITAATGASHVTTVIRPDSHHSSFISTPIGGPGDDRNASIARTNKAVVWDSVVAGLPGRQVFRRITGNPNEQLTNTPTGSCENPALDRRGNTVVFECTVDLAGTAHQAVRRIIRSDRFGSLTQISTGAGRSSNASITTDSYTVVFDSTDDPVDGHDTGISQIWLADLRRGTTLPITNGSGASTRPALTDRARIVAFQSTADLAGDGHDTGVNQIFAYDTRVHTFARVTDEPGGCTGASVMRAGVEYFIGFVCNGEARRYGLRADTYVRYPTPGGTVDSMVLSFSRHYVLISTNADLLSPGLTTAGDRLYLWNTYKLPGLPVLGSALWFPVRGL